MSLLVFQHDANEDPARLGAILRDLGHRLRVVELFGGDPVPPDFDDIGGILSLGGPMNVADTDEHPWIEPEKAYLAEAHDRGLPIVGLCLGAQLVASALGGEVAEMEAPEVGWHTVKLGFPGTIDPIYAGIPWETPQFHLHGWEVTDLPDDSTPLAGSKACRTQAFKIGLTTFGFQYHFEWEREDLEEAARDPLAAKAGVDADKLAAETVDHYGSYRRLGDRLSERIGLLLFPSHERMQVG